jgi:hypothetical protein
MDELGKSHSANVRELKTNVSLLFTITKGQELEMIDCNGIAIAAKMEAEQARKDFVKLPLRIAEMLKKPCKKRRYVRRKK